MNPSQNLKFTELLQDLNIRKAPSYDSQGLDFIRVHLRFPYSLGNDEHQDGFDRTRLGVECGVWGVVKKKGVGGRGCGEQNSLFLEPASRL